MDSFRRSKRSSAAATALALLAVLAIAGCGGGSSSSSSSGSGSGTEASGGEGSGANAEVVAAAKKIAEEHKSVTKIGPTKPIGKPVPEGKKLIYVECPEPACVTQSEAFSEAAKVLGWSVEDISTEYTPQAVQATFEEVIRRHPDGVASAGLGPAVYPKQLAKLNEMGIPVAESTGEVEGGTHGIAFDPVGPETASNFMRVLANKTIEDIEGEGEVGTVLLTESPIVADYTQAYEEEIAAKCPNCSTKRLELPPTAIGKSAPEEITNFLRANSAIKALFFSYDPFGEGLAAALKNAGVEMPKTYSWGVDAPGILALQSGERTASAPLPYNEVAWQTADGFARIFAGEKPKEPFQEALLWSDAFNNVPEQTEPYPEIVPGYKEQFEALWGK
jgi:ribose transport system substrate-binding protein